jgi:tetratricopeptide (TPR) repeat protein
LGGLVRRLAGREVPAPAGAAEWEAIQRLLEEGRRSDPAVAQEVRTLLTVATRMMLTTGEPQTEAPEAPPSFTNHEAALAGLNRAAGRRIIKGTPRVVQVVGLEGVGCTTVVAYWVRKAAKRYPGGQAYVDLRDHDPEPSEDDQSAVARHILRQLGRSEEVIPATCQARLRLYREVVKKRRTVIVLDHARSASQVEPFVTSAPGVFVIAVASRRVPELDATLLQVDPFSVADMELLLDRLLGEANLAAVRAERPTLVEDCEGLPYLARVAAADLMEWLERGGNAAPGPGRADSDGRPVRAAVERAYRRLAPDAAWLLRALATGPWLDTISPAAASAVAEVDEAEAARLLTVLARQQLMAMDEHSGRYRFTETVRDHVIEVSAEVDDPAVRAGARDRAVRWLRDFAVRADWAAHPERWAVSSIRDDIGPGEFATMGKGEALAALVTELENICGAVVAADAAGDGETVCHLCDAMWAAQLKAGRHDQVLPCLRIGVRVADALWPVSKKAARMHTLLGLALTLREEFREAETELGHAVRISQEAGHTLGHATAVESLGLMWLVKWTWQNAYDRFVAAEEILGTIGRGDPDWKHAHRAGALVKRHQGRCLPHLGRGAEARRLSDEALDFFRRIGDSYNEARTLTDLAEISLDLGDRASALRHIDKAMPLLRREKADFQITFLEGLRRRCVGGG